MNLSCSATDGIATAIPSPRIRGRRVTRTDGRFLEWAVLDAASAADLGRDNVGWLVGSHPGAVRTVEQLDRLDRIGQGGIWVVVPSADARAFAISQHWTTRYPGRAPARRDFRCWKSRRVWVVTPERLRSVTDDARAEPHGVAGVILLDRTCTLFQARNLTAPEDRFEWPARRRERATRPRNDRPQHIVNFRAAVSDDDWSPPLILLTERRLRAIDPEPVARAFCLDGFQFIDGSSFACWEVPITADDR